MNLSEIQESLSKVLPGPWKYNHSDGVVWASEAVKLSPESNPLGRVCDASGRWALHDPSHEAQIKANLEFIANCRQWIPALIEEVERLKAALDEVTLCPTCLGTCLGGEPDKCACDEVPEEKCPQCDGTGREFWQSEKARELYKS